MQLNQKQVAWLDGVWKRLKSMHGGHPLVNVSLDWLRGEFFAAANSDRNPVPDLPDDNPDEPR